MTEIVPVLYPLNHGNASHTRKNPPEGVDQVTVALFGFIEMQMEEDEICSTQARV